MQLSSHVIIPQQPVPSLTKWGVSPLADLVFRALAAFGPSPAADLARSLGLPTKRIRTALDELSGVEAATPDGTGLWRVRQTFEVISALRERQLSIARKRFALQYQMTRLDSAESLVEDDELRSPDAARALPGLDQVRSRIAELMGSERCEHISMNPEPVYDTAVIAAAAPANRSLVARGIKVLTLGVPVLDATEAHTLELVAHGMEYRELTVLPIKLMVIDRKTLILPLDPEDRTKGAWEITAPSVVDRLTTLFLQHWERAATPRGMFAAPPGLSPREQAIVSLLAAGHTDVSASEHLAVSLRTITYTITNLMERYGAKSRFQLGLLVAAESVRKRLQDDANQ